MRVVWLEAAIDDLQRLRNFIQPDNLEAAQRAFMVIRSVVVSLESNPRIGKSTENLPYYHDLIIPFGTAGYVIRHRIQGDTSYIIAVKHGKEDGFALQTESGWLVNDPVT